MRAAYWAGIGKIGEIGLIGGIGGIGLMVWFVAWGVRFRGSLLLGNTAQRKYGVELFMIFLKSLHSW